MKSWNLIPKRSYWWFSSTRIWVVSARFWISRAFHSHRTTMASVERHHPSGILGSVENLFSREWEELSAWRQTPISGGLILVNSFVLSKMVEFQLSDLNENIRRQWWFRKWEIMLECHCDDNKLWQLIFFLRLSNRWTSSCWEFCLEFNIHYDF